MTLQPIDLCRVPCGSWRIVRQDLQVPNVLDLDPLVVSCDLNHRPARVHGKVLWPERVMQELIAG